MSHRKQQEFMQAYKPIHERFERFCRVRVYGEMEHEDLLNETLLVAFKKWDTLKNKTALFSFLCGTAIKLLSNSKRKKKPETGIGGLNSIESEGAQPDSLIEVSMLYEALSKLPIEQKESLILFEINGFAIKEIAKLQDVSESAVKQRLRRGRIHLKKLLSEQNITHSINETAYE